MIRDSVASVWARAQRKGIAWLSRGDVFAETVYGEEFIWSLVAPKSVHLWVIAAPKSGSTWMSVLLTELLGWRVGTLVPAYGHREQEIDLARLASGETGANRISVHQHCRFSEFTISVMRRANIKAVLTCRNLYDTVVSLLDHMEDDPTSPLAFMRPSWWPELPRPDQEAFVVSMMMPWYFSFYAGWFTHLRESAAARERICISRYESLLADPAGQTERLLGHLNIECSRSAIEEAIARAEKRDTRRNVAGAGRGSMLSEGSIRKMEQMRAFYPHVDFSCVGIREESS